MFTSRKIIDDIKDVEVKPLLINQHCVVYKFSCDLCDTDYVGYTSRLLFQRIAEHKHSAIGKHLQEEHRLQPTNLQDQFTFLKKCRTKFDCLIYEMLFIRNIKPTLNTQSDSVRAKTFYITIEYLNTFFNSLHIFTLLLLYIQSILSCNSNSIMMTWSHRNVVLFILYRSCLF